MVRPENQQAAERKQQPLADARGSVSLGSIFNELPGSERMRGGRKQVAGTSLEHFRF
jgi:hypothetical protein